MSSSSSFLCWSYSLDSAHLPFMHSPTSVKTLSLLIFDTRSPSCTWITVGYLFFLCSFSLSLCVWWQSIWPKQETCPDGEWQSLSSGLGRSISFEKVCLSSPFQICQDLRAREYPSLPVWWSQGREQRILSALVPGVSLAKEVCWAPALCGGNWELQPQPSGSSQEREETEAL